MSTVLTQVLEILQAHGLMERSDETFLSARDLVTLDDFLSQFDMRGVRPGATVDDLRAQIRALEERIDDARAALG